MLVKVCQENINKGERGSSLRCPIALALKETVLREWVVGSAYVTDYTSKKKYYLPDEARVFIAAFDKKEKVEPIEFEMDCAP